METLARAANRGSISTGYDIDNSLKIEADNAERLQRVYSGQSGSVNSSTPTSTKIATFSFWIKRTELQPSGNHLIFLADANYTWIGFNNDRLYILGSTAGINLISTAVFRDTSAFYHIVVAFDTTQGTASNRVKAYVNGEQVTAWGGNENFGAQNNDIDLYDTNTSHYFGWSDAQSQSGYYAEAYLIDGQQLAPTEFGETDSDSGIWKPKAYGGTFGNQGWYLDFEDSSDLGKDVSGNGNNFTAHYNGSAADQATDTPTNNFCTLNQVMLTQANTVISQGATSLFSTGASGNTVVGTMGVSRGKWYWEFKHISAGGTAYWSAIGYTSSESTDSTQTAGGGSGYPSHVALLPNGGTFTNGSIISNKFNTFSANDIAGVALDMDNGDMYLYKNGTIQNSGNPIFTSIGDFAMPVGSVYLNGCGGYFNFGGFTSYTPSSAASDEDGYGTFEYAPPSGYYALCTKNLAEFG